MDLFEQLEIALQPKGTKPVVRLFLKDMGANYFSHDFVKECIKDMQKKSLLVNSGLYEFSPLERLGMHVLMDSSYIDKKDYNNENRT